VVIAFTNNTSNLADFMCVVGLPSGLLIEETARNVGPGETTNVVQDCPLEFVVPGSLGDSGTVDATAAEVTTGENAETAVTFDGSQLIPGFDFACGDVIEIELLPETSGDTTNFRIRVEVLPGR
jgi:hypothetical protein